MSKDIEIKKGDRILVSRTDRLGDLILALPLIESIKLRHPDCQVDVLASLYASPILENNPHIDSIIRVQNDQLRSVRHYGKELFGKIRKNNYQVAVVVFPDRMISRMIHKSGVKYRLGTAGRFHSVFFNHHLLHTRKANKKHEMEYNLDFLKFFSSGESVSSPRVYLDERELNNAIRILKEAEVKGKFVVLHPGSGGSAHRWPVDKFMQLHENLTKAGYQVVITGSSEEEENYRRMDPKLISRMKILAGQTDLRTLAAILSRADCLVSNSTGPLHLAAAVGTRVVGLYPRQKIMSPVRWGPIGTGNHIVQPQSPECDCPPKECLCMTTISIERVASRVEKLMHEPDLA